MTHFIPTRDPMHRRTFNRLLFGSAGALLTGCVDRDRYTEEDEAALERHWREEEERSGKGPDGVQRYRGYRGLAELPWFELDDRGRLVCTVPDLPPAIDFHCHFGMSFGLAPEVDLMARTPRVRHLLDCDATDPGCELDLDVYMNANFTEEDLAALRRGAVAQALWGSESAATHTVPNLLAEMDDTKIARAVILPIAFGLPVGDDLASRWLAAIDASGSPERFIRGGTVHPSDPDKIEKLRQQAEAGVQVVKLHPAMQRFFPDSEEAGEVYAECARLGLVVFFHGGRAGIEPHYNHQFTPMKNYAPAFERYPEVNFVLGHAGARDVADAIPLAVRHPNVQLGIHGQGVTVLRELIERVGPDKLIFGTDWPFYHLAATLAKVLMVTEGSPGARRAILTTNAEALLARAGAGGGVTGVSPPGAESERPA
ncbi:MAG: amidohydrolase family protein [Myxococcota bacterium]